MAEYSLREATSDDIELIIRHRLHMFREMGVHIDEELLAERMRPWLSSTIPVATYRAWLVETAAKEVVAGGGITILPWPPGPRDFSGQLPIVYNMYTDPPHRGQGLARRIMHAIHDWCRQGGYELIGLAASDAARPLYDSLGYEVARQPYMFKAL